MGKYFKYLLLSFILLAGIFFFGFSKANPAWACTAWTSCAGCGRNFSGSATVDCSCACQGPSGECFNWTCSAYCVTDAVGCPVSISASCDACSGGGPQPTPTPIPQPPTCVLSGPLGIEINKSGIYTANASGNGNTVRRIEILRAQVNYWDYKDSQGKQMGWIKLGEVASSGGVSNLSATWATNAGDVTDLGNRWWVVCNAYYDVNGAIPGDKNKQCSGNPFGLPSDWSDCGGSDAINTAVTGWVIGRVNTLGEDNDGDSCPDQPFWRPGTCSNYPCPGDSCKTAGLSLVCNGQAVNWSCNECGAYFYTGGFDAGANVTCTASGAPLGYEFKMWGRGSSSGGCSGNSCTASFPVWGSPDGLGFWVGRIPGVTPPVTPPTPPVTPPVTLPPTNTPTQVPPTPTWTPTPTPTPLPSCNLTLSGPTFIDQGDIKDYVVLVTVQDGGALDVSGVNFFSSNSSIARVETGWVAYPPPYSTRVIGVFVGPVTITARANLSGGNTCSNSLDVTVGPPDAWFQTWGGDVHAQGPIFSDVPEAATYPYFSVDLDGYPGVISYLNSLTVGAVERISSKKWNVDTFLVYPYDFSYFHKKLDPGPANWDGASGNLTFPAADEFKIVYTENPAEIPSFTLNNGRKLVILVKNEVNIKGDLKVTKGTDSFLAIIASGDINLDSSVSHVEGIFIADGGFNVGSGSSQFTGEGTFYALGFNLPRDLILGNSLNPAELFTFRPDLVVNTPVELRITAMSWQEVAP